VGNQSQIKTSVNIGHFGTDELEGTLDKLQKLRFEDVLEDNKGLIAQQNILKELVHQSNEKNRLLTEALKLIKTKSEEEKKNKQNQLSGSESQVQRIEQLMKVINERERRIVELQRYEFSFKKVSDINQQYEKEAASQKLMIQELKAKYETLEAAHNESSAHSIQLERAVEHLRGRYEEAKLEAKNLEQDFQEAQTQIEEMKQTLVRGLKEAKDIKQYYQNLANEKSAAIQKTFYMQEHVKELNEEIKKKDKSLEEFREKMHRMELDKLEFEKKIEAEREKHKNYEWEIQEQEESLFSFAEQIKTMQAKLKTAEESCILKDASVIEAQQQFAKKAREVAKLSEINEEQAGLIAKLQNEVMEAKIKTDEAHGTLESKTEQFKAMQHQITVAEQKYFQVQEKLLEIESQNRELRKIEEKHQQTQALLASLGAVVGSPIGLTQPIGLVSSSVKAPVSPTSISVPKTKETVFHVPEKAESLFDFQDPPPSKFKRDLFE